MNWWTLRHHCYGCRERYRQKMEALRRDAVFVACVIAEVWAVIIFCT